MEMTLNPVDSGAFSGMRISIARFAAMLVLIGLAQVSEAQQTLKSIVPRVDVSAPVGNVVGWDRTFVFNDVAGASGFQLEVVRPKFGSCVLPARAGRPERLTVGTSGGVIKQTFLKSPPVGKLGAVCQFGECRIVVPTFGVHYYEPVGPNGSACRISTQTYVWSIRTEDGHFSDRTPFVPALARYDF